jgi:hypothetical protein
MAHAQSAIGYPAWVARYRFPETFRFKHLLPHQPFRMGDRVYARISARRYAPASVSFDGKVTIHSAPVRSVANINGAVITGSDLCHYQPGL